VKQNQRRAFRSWRVPTVEPAIIKLKINWQRTAKLQSLFKCAQLLTCTKFTLSSEIWVSRGCVDANSSLLLCYAVSTGKHLTMLRGCPEDGDKTIFRNVGYYLAVHAAWRISRQCHCVTSRKCRCFTSRQCHCFTVRLHKVSRWMKFFKYKFLYSCVKCWVIMFNKQLPWGMLERT
jgi:hypothetical protein